MLIFFEQLSKSTKFLIVLTTNCFLFIRKHRQKLTDFQSNFQNLMLSKRAKISIDKSKNQANH
jgi:hypothetical protein